MANSPPDQFLDKVTCGDCVELMHQLPPESVHFCMFSPPYWGLRDYGIEGQIGLESTYQEYVAKMVEVGREIRRVLRKDGSWYLNLGDTYAGSGCGAQHGWGDYKREKVIGTMDEPSPQTQIEDVEPKCKLLIPYRVALALIDDGWTCRNDITWYKPNAMPSSVKDRLTCQTERIFHLVKSRTYYYDLDVIREPHSIATIKHVTQPTVFEQAGGAKQDMLNPITGVGGNYNRPAEMVKSIAKNILKRNIVPGQPRQSIANHSGYFGPNGECHVDFEKGKNPGDVTVSEQNVTDERKQPLRPDQQPTRWERGKNVWEERFAEGGKNPGDVIGDFWPITTKPFSGAHFAVFPEALCERPIKSSCPPDGIVLDPMAGSGTTLVVAKRLGRHFIGFDLNPDYCDMARRRLAQVEYPLNHFAKEAR